MKYTWKQIVTKTGLDIPMSTANTYRDKFICFMPHTGEGRRRLYAEQAVEVLLTVANMYRQGIASNLIQEALESKYAPIVEMGKDNNIVTASPHQQILEDIRVVFREEMESQNEKIAQLEQRISELLTTQLRHNDKVNWWDKWRNKKSP